MMPMLEASVNELNAGVVAITRDIARVDSTTDCFAVVMEVLSFASFQSG